MTDVKRGFVEWAQPLMLRHLKEDIMPFWTQTEMLGDPFGRFPTFASQDGHPDWSRPRYVRMHGRQTYAYLAAYELLKEPPLLDYGLAGLRKLEDYENPNGGYYSQIGADDVALDTPVTIQDQCYSAFPYLMAYRVTGERRHLDRIWRFVDFIDNGPYRRADGSYVDSLRLDLKKEVFFETPTMNIVSVIDFLNLILIPALALSPAAEISGRRKDLLVKWTDLLVSEFYGKGVFWNERGNRDHWRAKHVDLGHTAKSYGILKKASRLFANWRVVDRHAGVLSGFPPIVRAAADRVMGWKTDFDVSATTFLVGDMQWWRHAIIDQTVYHFLDDCPSLVNELRQGVLSWLDSEYVDRRRLCRGIRETLGSDGKCAEDVVSNASKANLWKSGYHEVEHVLTLTGRELPGLIDERIH